MSSYVRQLDFAFNKKVFPCGRVSIAAMDRLRGRTFLLRKPFSAFPSACLKTTGSTGARRTAFHLSGVTANASTT